MDDVVTKFPTTTTTIVAGWTNPTNAYAEDGVNTYSSTNGAEQKYGGWNFTTSDIPSGSTITKVEMGAKHYEVNPTGYYHITTLKYVESTGLIVTFGLTQRTTLTWDWVDITSCESSWDLTKLNNADVRIIMTEEAIEGGCLFEKGDEKTYVLGIDEEGFFMKPASELKVGDIVIVWTEKDRKLVKAKVTEVSKNEGVLKFINIVFQRVKAPSLTFEGQYVESQPYTIVTADQPLVVFKKPEVEKEVFTQGIRLTAEELYQRVLAGEEFWTGSFRNWNIQMEKIERVELIETNGVAYKIKTELDGTGAHVFAETLTPTEIKKWEMHGYSLREIPKISKLLWKPEKATCYVDAVALRVTFTPSAVGQYYNIGEGLTNETIYT
jgi:hypothetical protein